MWPPLPAGFSMTLVNQIGVCSARIQEKDFNANINKLTTMKNTQLRFGPPVLTAFLAAFSLAAGMAHAGSAVNVYVCVSQDSHANRMGLAMHPDGRFIEAQTKQTSSGDVDITLVGTNSFNDRHEYVQVLGGAYVGTQLIEKQTGMRFWSYEKTGPDMFKLTGIRYVDRITGKETDISKMRWMCKRDPAPAGDAAAEQTFQQIPRGSFY
jgi:hypothetical protein